jgi:hypothetical protein
VFNPIEKTMTLKEQLIQELDTVSEPVLVEVLDFLQFIKAKQEEEHEDVRDARAALARVSTEGTVAWNDLKAEIGL